MFKQGEEESNLFIRIASLPRPLTYHIFCKNVKIVRKWVVLEIIRKCLNRVEGSVKNQYILLFRNSLKFVCNFSFLIMFDCTSSHQRPRDLSLYFMKNFRDNLHFLMIKTAVKGCLEIYWLALKKLAKIFKELLDCPNYLK